MIKDNDIYHIHDKRKATHVNLTSDTPCEPIILFSCLFL